MCYWKVRGDIRWPRWTWNQRTEMNFRPPMKTETECYNHKMQSGVLWAGLSPLSPLRLRDLAVDARVSKLWSLGWEKVMKMENEVHKKKNNEMRQRSVLTDLSPPRGWNRSETLTGKNKKWGKRNCWTKNESKTSQQVPMSGGVVSAAPTRIFKDMRLLCLDHRRAPEEQRPQRKPLGPCHTGPALASQPAQTPHCGDPC